MIWLTWRQFRVQAAVVFGAIVALAVVLVVTGRELADSYAAGLAACTASGGCSAFLTNFLRDHDAQYYGLAAVTMALPGILGVFWGAPLVSRELETGTHRLVWSQSITRTRWLAVKLGLVGLASMLAAGLLSLAVSWWATPLDEAGASARPRLSPVVFAARDLAPIGYVAFAFVVGVAVGMLVRRALPAMAVTLAIFVALQIAVPLWVRPSLLPPVEATVAITPENLRGIGMSSPDGTARELTIAVEESGSWILDSDTVGADGAPVGALPAWFSECDPIMLTGPPTDPAVRNCFDRLAEEGYRQHITYHPGSRYWTFQWLEVALYGAATLAAAGFAFWWLRKRLC
ncbi:ABC-2 family transporter [Prauserella shujinwangii]|uniref:ABC-2 family transporter n=1 Tax=Prauserella shujinwangii TaxID=1453103 RepID=A0A2T0LPG7_9PSEU|nr:ABC transporter permease subunit [Prauserella shujinwangii]PRX45139.1 ABC-2 family transporter [Prauserella shujinwangii]